MLLYAYNYSEICINQHLLRKLVHPRHLPMLVQPVAAKQVSQTKIQGLKKASEDGISLNKPG
jgi:hypothetical protein